MKTLRVVTAEGAVYILRECTAYGMDAVIGKAGAGELRIHTFAETDKVTEIA